MAGGDVAEQLGPRVRPGRARRRRDLHRDGVLRAGGVAALGADDPAPARFVGDPGEAGLDPHVGGRHGEAGPPAGQVLGGRAADDPDHVQLIPGVRRDGDAHAGPRLGAGVGDLDRAARALDHRDGVGGVGVRLVGLLGLVGIFRIFRVLGLRWHGGVPLLRLAADRAAPALLLAVLAGRPAAPGVVLLRLQVDREGLLHAADRAGGGAGGRAGLAGELPLLGALVLHEVLPLMALGIGVDRHVLLQQPGLALQGAVLVHAHLVGVLQAPVRTGRGLEDLIQLGVVDPFMPRGGDGHFLLLADPLLADLAAVGPDHAHALVLAVRRGLDLHLDHIRLLVPRFRGDGDLRLPIDLLVAVEFLGVLAVVRPQVVHIPLLDLGQVVVGIRLFLVPAVSLVPVLRVGRGERRSGQRLSGRPRVLVQDGATVGERHGVLPLFDRFLELRAPPALIRLGEAADLADAVGHDEARLRARGLLQGLRFAHVAVAELVGRPGDMFVPLDELHMPARSAIIAHGADTGLEALRDALFRAGGLLDDLLLDAVLRAVLRVLGILMPQRIAVRRGIHQDRPADRAGFPALVRGLRAGGLGVRPVLHVVVGGGDVPDLGEGAAVVEGLAGDGGLCHDLLICQVEYRLPIRPQDDLARGRVCFRVRRILDPLGLPFDLLRPLTDELDRDLAVLAVVAAPGVAQARDRPREVLVAGREAVDVRQDLVFVLINPPLYLPVYEFIGRRAFHAVEKLYIPPFEGVTVDRHISSEEDDVLQAPAAPERLRADLGNTERDDELRQLGAARERAVRDRFQVARERQVHQVPAARERALPDRGLDEAQFAVLVHGVQKGDLPQVLAVLERILVDGDAAGDLDRVQVLRPGEGVLPDVDDAVGQHDRFQLRDHIVRRRRHRVEGVVPDRADDPAVGQHIGDLHRIQGRGPFGRADIALHLRRRDALVIISGIGEQRLGLLRAQRRSAHGQRRHRGDDQ